MRDVVNEKSETGYVYLALDGVKVGDIFAYRLHDRFTDLCNKYVVSCLYKRMGNNLACVCYADGFFDTTSPKNILKNDFFIENVGEDWTKAITENKLNKIEIERGEHER